MRYLLALFLLVAISVNAQHTVTATYYHAGPKYGLSWYTASGSKINLNKLKVGKLRWVALSRDMFKHYDYGDTIIVISSNPELKGKWVVKDKMGAKHKKRIDFLTHPNNTLGLVEPTKIKIK